MQCLCNTQTYAGQWSQSRECEFQIITGTTLSFRATLSLYCTCPCSPHETETPDDFEFDSQTSQQFSYETKDIQDMYTTYTAYIIC